MERAFLSLCLIVRDAEETLVDLLSSVLDCDGFDEIIIVDTGSVDGTRDLIRGVFDMSPFDVDTPGAGNVFVMHEVERKVRGRPLHEVERKVRGRPLRAVLARFDWCDDFSAARNYSFSLAKGDWRMYLDADDVLVCEHPFILEGRKRDDGTPMRFDVADTIRRAVERDPASNAISMPYNYVEGEVRQDVIRAWRWADGWKWRDAVHENVVQTVDDVENPEAHQRVIVPIEYAVVQHKKSPDEHERSFDRNSRIIAAQLARTDLTADVRARLKYQHTSELRRTGRTAEAVAVLEEVAEEMYGDSYSLLAMRDLVKVLTHDMGDDLSKRRALEWAGKMIARWPALADGYEHLGWVYTLMGGCSPAAASAFDLSRALLDRGGGRLLWSTAEDVWFTEGAVPAAAALSYALLGRSADAHAALQRVKYPQHYAVKNLAVAASRRTARLFGIEAVYRYADFLLAAQRPGDAEALLLEAANGVLESESAVLQARARAVRAKMSHLESLEAYEKAYAPLHDDAVRRAGVRREDVLGLARVVVLLGWAKTLAEQDLADGRVAGEGRELLFVGVQDGIMEAEVLEILPGAKMTIVDVVRGSSATEALLEEYGDRVDVYAPMSIVDWCPPGREKSYDLAVCFEVVEHVYPWDAERGIHILEWALNIDGRLLVSTPCADRWVESKPNTSFFDHVHVYGPREFYALFDAYTGHPHNEDQLVEGHDGTLVMLTGVMRKDLRTDARSIAIYVPDGGKPFDARSHERGHLGGSEEAVIHLSEALAARGHEVTVYAPDGGGLSAGHILARRGVFWRPSREFDFGGHDHDHVLFWRCPTILNHPEEFFGPYEKTLWLHDSYYRFGAGALGGPRGISRKTYEAADYVVALSHFHALCLQQKDECPKEKIVVLGNGIAEEEFPPFDEGERDPNKVLYTSSPDRGLERLLRAWRDIKARCPEATLDIYYDWAGASWVKPDLVARLHEMIDNLNQNAWPREDGHGVVSGDVRLMGGVNHATLHAAMRRAGVWAYPHEGGGPESEAPSPETFCISVVKAEACGCYPVTTMAGAIHEVTFSAKVLPVDEGGFVATDEVVDAVCDRIERGREPAQRYRAAMRESALRNWSWARTAERFEEALGLRAPWAPHDDDVTEPGTRRPEEH